MKVITDEYKEAVASAIAFKVDNPAETHVAGARIYGINENTLKSRRQRLKKRDGKLPPTRGGHNKILSDTQTQAIYKYVRDMYLCGLGATKPMVLGAIAHLKACEDPPRPPPSERWFQTFIRDHANLFKTTKTKPIARNRVSAQDVEDVTRWFDSFREYVEKHNVKREDVMNFDEAGFQIGMCCGEEILIPADVDDVRIFIIYKKKHTYYSIACLYRKL